MFKPGRFILVSRVQYQSASAGGAEPYPVCVVSALAGWGTEDMVATMMRSLPDRATSPVATQLHGRLCTESVRSQARDSFGGAVGRVFDTAESSSFQSAPLKTVMRTVRDAVVSVARAIWNVIFF